MHNLLLLLLVVVAMPCSLPQLLVTPRQLSFG
jgi:hypothetical protein